MLKDSAPDSERQSLGLLKGLTFVIAEKKQNHSSITLVNCAVLDLASLEPFLHGGLISLNLSGCHLIKEDAVQAIQKRCPLLKKLFLNRCAQLKVFENKASFINSASDLIFANLETLQIGIVNFLNLFA